MQSVNNPQQLKCVRYVGQHAWRRRLACCVIALGCSLCGVIACAARAVLKQPPAKLSHAHLSALPHGLNFKRANWYNLQQPLANSSNQRAIAHALGWVHDSDSSDLCAGYYQQPPELQHALAASLHSSAPITVTASGPTTLLNDGRTVLRQHVQAVQQGRITRGDYAILYRDKNSGKIQRIKIFGHVHYAERDRVLVGSYALIDVVHHSMHMDHALYHLYGSTPEGTQQNAWGSAASIDRGADNILILHHATYSTCSPAHNVWRISARRLKINKRKGWGQGYHVILRVKRAPVFYTPYINFPVDHRRKSGFLWPSVSSVFSKRRGTDLTLPFYWNLAPNYDAVIAPRWMTKRGVLFDQQFRYLSLSKRHHGYLDLGFIPHDRAFAKLRKSFAAYPAITPAVQQQQYDMSTFRNSVQYKDTGSWGKRHQWSSQVQLQHVSDPYYLQDFQHNAASAPGAISDSQANQLLNQARLAYQGNAWQWSLQGMGYQTLQPVNQPMTSMQYWRLPEFHFSSFLPRRLFHQLDVSGSGQVVNFAMPFDPHAVAGAGTNADPVGLRVHTQPGLMYPITGHGFVLTPQLWLDNLLVAYHPQAYPSAAPPVGTNLQQQSVARSIPEYGVDARTYLQSMFKLHGHPWVQTVEPELFYLYVPYRNQDKIPVFDTQMQTFNYDRLFALNQFTGPDRMQNANQLSMGLKFRTIDGVDGRPLLTIGNGLVWYFADRKVALSPSIKPLDVTRTERVSPLVSQLSFNPASYLNFTGDSTWDLHKNQLDNADASASVIISPAYQLNGGYQFVANGVWLNGKYVNLQQASVGLNLSLTSHVKALAYGFYNFTQRYPINSFAGMEYDSCCWRMRAVLSHYYQSLNQVQQPQMETRFYLQLELSGLGSVGNHNPGSLLSTVPGYVDPFNTRGII